MSTSMQASAYWQGYATALMQVVKNDIPQHYTPETKEVLLRQNYENILKQHDMGLHWVEFFLGEDNNV